MPLDRIATDPIISTENTTFTPSCPHPPELLPLTSQPTLSSSECDPLVGAHKPKKPFYRARPLWLVPFALTASITCGMTLASRVEVFTELSCRQLHHHYNHTSTPAFSGVNGFAHPQSEHSSLNSPSVSLPVQVFEESASDGVAQGDDPRVLPEKKCVSDPAVQAGAARIQTIMTTTTGTLSALTVGWWGHFGERHGRTRVLAVSAFGLFLTNLVFILVSTRRNSLAEHSHKLLLLSAIIDGSLGGWSLLGCATTAYVADCTSPDSRATIFARFTGVLFVGLALGPMIGAWLIRNPASFMEVGQAGHSLQGVNSVFWVAISGSFVNLLFALFVLPESLPTSPRAVNRKGKNRAIEGDEIGTNGNHSWVFGVVQNFVSPLAEFLPNDAPVAQAVGMPSRQLARKDWSLTFLALSLFVNALATSLFQLKYLYAEHVYNWGAEQLGYYISFLGSLRAFHLFILLPFLLITFKPAQKTVSPAVSAQSNTSSAKTKSKPTTSHLFSRIRFDLLVVRYSMFVEFCSHALVVLSPLPSNDVASTRRSQFIFIATTSLACASAGVTPAAQSLALSILQARKMAEKEEMLRLQGGTERASIEQDAEPESGKLFGAVSALQSIGQAILGPLLFGMIYTNTVASFPKAIFVAAAVLIAVALALTVFVNPDFNLAVLKNARRKRKCGVVSKYSVEERRGRSRVRKDLRGGSASTSYGATRHGQNACSAGTEAGTSGHACGSNDGAV